MYLINKHTQNRCYPINSTLADPIELDRKLRLWSTQNDKPRICNDSSSSSDTSDSSCSSSDSDDDDDSDLVCIQNFITVKFSETVLSLLYKFQDSINNSDSDSSNDNNDDVVLPALSDKCRVCEKPQNINRDNKPEMFVMCSTCRRRGNFMTNKLNVLLKA